MTKYLTVYVAETEADSLPAADDQFGDDGAEFSTSVDLISTSGTFEPEEFTTYGLALDRTNYERQHERPRSVIGAVTRSAAGNVVLRVGREAEVGGSYELTEHVVLTPAEARALALEIL